MQDNVFEPKVDAPDTPSFHKVCAELREKLSQRGKRVEELAVLLQNIVTVNPYFRMTARECLSNRVFDPFRDPVKEKIISELHKNK